MNKDADNYEDGYLKVNGIKIYYRRYGKGNRQKLMTLHGGPGASHDILLPLTDLVGHDYDILFYDQSGCGKSEDPKDDSGYTFQHGIEEANIVRDQVFGDHPVNLLGESYGGAMALAYAIKYQDKLRTVISVSGFSSNSRRVSETLRLVSLLPEKYFQAMISAANTNNYNSESFQEAYGYFYNKHIFRVSPSPKEYEDSIKMMNERKAHAKMLGTNPLGTDGTMKGIEFTADLDRIRIPTLILSGKYDMITPEISEEIHSRIKNSEIFIFGESSHNAIWEVTERFMEVVDSYIKKHDGYST